MSEMISRNEALELLKEHNKEAFHIQHGLTVEGVMRWFARELGYGEDEEYWGLVGLLHDVDFEEYPEEHCIKAPEILAAAGVGDDMIRSICSHGYGLTGVDIQPEHEMEKVLYACDELTGIIGAAALMRPSKSLKKKYKSANFAAGCSREVIGRGAEMLGWELADLQQITLDAMKSCEASVNEEMAAL